MCFLDERVAHDGDVARSHKNDDGWNILKTPIGWCISISLLVPNEKHQTRRVASRNSRGHMGGIFRVFLVWSDFAIPPAKSQCTTLGRRGGSSDIIRGSPDEECC